MSAPDPPRDEDLVDAANGGDHAALSELYERYRVWILRLAERTTGDRDLALDVLQETIAWLLGRFPGFELRARMTTVLYPVVRHLSIAMQQRRRRERAFARGMHPTQPATHAAPGETTDERMVILARVLETLPAAHREVVHLRYVDGLSLSEIALATEVPLGTVKSRLHHALAALRESELRGILFFD